MPTSEARDHRPPRVGEADLAQLREVLASTLYGRDDASEFTTWDRLPDWNRRMWLADADALLPAITVWAARRTARELRAAADRISRGPETWVGARHLQARANALTANNQGGQE